MKDYREFREKFKFKPKKTTDDCYTPEDIYKVVETYCRERYGIEAGDIVRPFWPGCDYKAAEYPEGCCVVDNPPFSILAEIREFYIKKGIKFFLFAPSKTCISRSPDTTAIITETDITYKNGATVATAFITNMEPGIVVRTCPVLGAAIRSAEKKRKEEKKENKIPKYEYPANVIHAARIEYYARHGVEYKVRKEDCVFIRALDSMKEAGKAIYGAGLLLSEKAAAEKAAAEKAAETAKDNAAAEKAAAEKAAAITWTLSKREKEIIRNMGEKRC